jgi:hypothetical protein
MGRTETPEAAAARQVASRAASRLSGDEVAQGVRVEFRARLSAELPVGDAVSGQFVGWWEAVAGGAEAGPVACLPQWSEERALRDWAEALGRWVAEPTNAVGSPVARSSRRSPEDEALRHLVISSSVCGRRRPSPRAPPRSRSQCWADFARRHRVPAKLPLSGACSAEAFAWFALVEPRASEVRWVGIEDADEPARQRLVDGVRTLVASDRFASSRRRRVWPGEWGPLALRTDFGRRPSTARDRERIEEAIAKGRAVFGDDARRQFVLRLAEAAGRKRVRDAVKAAVKKALPALMAKGKGASAKGTAAPKGDCGDP